MGDSQPDPRHDQSVAPGSSSSSSGSSTSSSQAPSPPPGATAIADRRGAAAAAGPSSGVIDHCGRSGHDRSRYLFNREAKFVPNEELVKQMVEMGICRNGAVKALYWTGNQSVVAASNWIFDQVRRLSPYAWIII